MSTIQDHFPSAVENVNQMIDCLWSFSTALSMRSFAAKDSLRVGVAETTVTEALSAQPIVPIPVRATQKQKSGEEPHKPGNSKQQIAAPSRTDRSAKTSNFPNQGDLSLKRKVISSELPKIADGVGEYLSPPPKLRGASKSREVRRKLVIVGDGVSSLILAFAIYFVFTRRTHHEGGLHGLDFNFYPASQC